MLFNIKYFNSCACHKHERTRVNRSAPLHPRHTHTKIFRHLYLYIICTYFCHWELFLTSVTLADRIARNLGTRLMFSENLLQFSLGYCHQYFPLVCFHWLLKPRESFLEIFLKDWIPSRTLLLYLIHCFQRFGLQCIFQECITILLIDIKCSIPKCKDKLLEEEIEFLVLYLWPIHLDRSKIYYS